MTWAPGTKGITFPVYGHEPAEGQEKIEHLPYALVDEYRAHLQSTYGRSIEYLAAHGGVPASDVMLWPIIEARTLAAAAKKRGSS